jgi:serine/threonine protein kinase
MELYPLGNIKDVGMLYDQFITVFAQILFGLSHLHKNGVAHRDLKPENFLVKKKPFTIAITDFGLSKVKDDDTLLKTFCGNLKHLAPEAFPGLSDSDGYGPEVDIWSAGVIMLEWMYNIPDHPVIPMPKRKGQQVTEKQWHDWVTVWVELLLEKLGDQEADDTVVKILLGMIEPDPKKRWSADRCLKCGLQSGLFKMATDGRIVGVDDPDEKNDEDEDDSDDGTKTPIARSPTAILSAARPSQGTQANMNVDKTILDGCLWGGRGSTVQRSGRTRRKEHDLNPQHHGKFEVPDLFGSHWLRDPNCVGSDVAALGDDVDEEGSRLSNWTSVHSENSVSASTSNVSNEQNSNQGSPLEGTEEPCMLEDCQPLYQPGIEWGQAGMSSREPTDRPTRTVQQPHSEAMAVESSGATNPHNEDGRVRPQ